MPPSHKEEVKTALFEMGAGKFKNYDSCSFESEGWGQFRPIDGANPFLGNLNKLEKLREFKVEMICEDDLIHEAVRVLKATHPYEEVAFEVYKIENF